MQPVRKHALSVLHLVQAWSYGIVHTCSGVEQALDINKGASRRLRRLDAPFI